MRVAGVLVLCLLLPFVCLGKTIYVLNGAQNGEGTLSLPFGDIQSAFAVAESGDEIIISPDGGVYRGPKNAGMVMTTSTITSISFVSATTRPVIIDLSESDDPFLNVEPSPFHPYYAHMKFMTFTGKEAGNIIEFSGELDLVRTNFSNNEVKNGHCLYAYDSTISLDNCVFSKNGGYSNGPSLYLNNTQGVISRSYFKNHSSPDYLGGAAYITGPLQRVVFDDCYFLYNNANQGGAMFMDRALVNITNSLFSMNNAGQGGAVFSQDGTLEGKSSRFLINAAQEGGAVKILGNQAQFQNCSWQDNEATETDGGALAIGRDAFVILNNGCLFSNNHCLQNGGAIALQDSAKASLNNAVIFKNAAGTFGGGIYTEKSTTLSLISCTMQSNLAENGGGGGIFGVFDATRQSFFENNVARASGGGLYLGTNATVSQARFELNKAFEIGGAIFADFDGELSLFDANFSKNSAGQQGASVGIIGGVKGEIEVCQFDDDKSSGGVIFLNQTKPFTLNGVTFTNLVESATRLYVEGEAEGVLTLNFVSFQTRKFSSTYIADRHAVINNPIDGGFHLFGSTLSLCGGSFGGDGVLYDISTWLENDATVYFSKDSEITGEIEVTDHGNFLVAPHGLADCLLGPVDYDDKKRAASIHAVSKRFKVFGGEAVSTDISWTLLFGHVEGYFYINGTDGNLNGDLVLMQNSAVGDPGDAAKRNFTFSSSYWANFYPGGTIYGNFNAGEQCSVKFLFPEETETTPVDVKGDFYWLGDTHTQIDKDGSFKMKVMTYNTHRGKDSSHSPTSYFTFEAHSTYLLSIRKDGFPGWAIGLIVTGSVLVLVLILGGVYVWRRKRLQKSGEDGIHLLGINF